MRTSEAMWRDAPLAIGDAIASITLQGSDTLPDALEVDARFAALACDVRAARQQLEARGELARAARLAAWIERTLRPLFAVLCIGIGSTLRSHCESLGALFYSRLLRALLDGVSPEDAERAALSTLRAHGLELPRKSAPWAAMRRLANPRWWLRTLRSRIVQAWDQCARALGRVHRGAEAYASEAAVEHHRNRRRENEAVLATLEAVADDGQRIALLELHEHSQANPVNRRAELMTRIRGIEEFAAARAHVGAFVTVTAPSRFHARYEDGRAVSGYSYDDPREAHRHLQRVWSRVRAALRRRTVRCYGIRVVEPHHDGTPHNHFLMFAEDEAQLEIIRATIERYALEDSPDESGAREHRFKFERVDSSRGTAAGYIAKYVAKNIDGFGNKADEYGRDAADSAERIQAWAKTWRVRQFSFFGTSGVAVYRELRRLRGRRLAAPYAAAHEAADTGDWCAYMEANPGVGRAAMMRPVYGTRVSSVTGECGPALNAYGEARADIVGVRATGCDVPVVTRDRLWRIERRSSTSTKSSVDSDAHSVIAARSDLDLCQ